MGLVYLFYFTFSYKALFITVVGNPTPFPKITNTYSDIFPDYDPSMLKPSYTFYSNYKAPKGSFSLDNDQYSILVYKLDSVKTQKKISELLNFRWDKASGLTPGITYDESYRDGNFVFSDANKKSRLGNKIIINIKASSKKLNYSNDSLMHFNLAINRFSGEFEQDKHIAFQYKKTNRLASSVMEIELAFIIKSNCSYMIILSPNYPKTNLNKKDILLSLLKTKLSLMETNK